MNQAAFVKALYFFSAGPAGQPARIPFLHYAGARRYQFRKASLPAPGKIPAKRPGKPAAQASRPNPGQ